MVKSAANFLGRRFCAHFNERFTTVVFLLIAATILPISILAQETKPGEPEKPSPAAPSAADALTRLRQQLQQLTGEVSRLQAELAKLDQYRNIDCTREVMIKEEQRIRELQKELVDDAAKETMLQKRLDEIEEEQRPDRIERALAGVGSVKPETDREAISTRLANEKRRIQSQLDALRAARARIPPLITNAEESIARLKQRLTEMRSRPGYSGLRTSPSLDRALNRCLQSDSLRR